MNKVLAEKIIDDLKEEVRRLNEKIKQREKLIDYLCDNFLYPEDNLPF